MKQRAAVVTLVVILLFSVVSGQAQSCPKAKPLAPGIDLTAACSVCIAGQPVTFTIVPHDVPCPVQSWMCDWPYVLQSCDTVTWDFGDGTASTTGAGSSVTHTFAAGNRYNVTVTMANALGSASRTFPVTIGESAPTFLAVQYLSPLSEAAPALTLTFTRSGNLDATSYIHYYMPGGPHLATTNGVLYFLAGESTKTASIPVLNDDKVWTGSSMYDLELESLDATVLTGAARDKYNLTRAHRTLEIVDDEARPRLRLQDVTIVEGDTGFKDAVVHATLDTAPGYTEMLPLLTSADTSDMLFTKPWGQMTAYEGGTDAQGRFAIRGDNEAEADETFTISVDSAGLSAFSPTIEKGTATLTILNDDINFGQQFLYINAGESFTVPINLGNLRSAEGTLTVAPDDAGLLKATTSVGLGESKGTVKIDALRGGDTLVQARYTDSRRTAKGSLLVHVAQATTLVAEPAALRVRVGEEATLVVSVVPVQNVPTSVTVQTQSAAIAIVGSDSAEAPAMFKVRGVAPGTTSLVISAGGQAASITVPVEVVSGVGRKRATKP